jgi:hypothetical protein
MQWYIHRFKTFPYRIAMLFHLEQPNAIKFTFRKCVFKHEVLRMQVEVRNSI